jgi:signal transduction histidine kinase
MAEPETESHRRLGRHLLRAAVIVTGCACLAAFTASQISLFLRSTGGDAPWPRLFFGQLIWWLLWAALVPIVLWMSRRYPLERGRRAQRTLIHLGAAAAVGLTHTLARVASLPLILGHTELQWAHEVVFSFSTYFHWNIVLYVLVVASEHAWRYRQRYRQRELEASRLQARLARAELDALRRQLHPHFLFNAMQGVAELIHEHPQRAEAVVLQLSELLRWTLGHSDSMEVTLREELEFVERYLAVEKVRFEERLSIVWNVPPETFEARVPQLVLQHLVENALRHGLASRAEGGTLTIAAEERDDHLELSVADDGIGLGEGSARWGLGLKNTRARLERLYGKEQRLELEPRPCGGVVARVVIPFCRAGAEPAEAR